jgi:hypothetical protein
MASAYSSLSVLQGLNPRCLLLKALVYHSATLTLADQRMPSGTVNILKTILVKCGGLTFHKEYCHVEAHQDELKNWEELPCMAQLNATYDAGAKAIMWMQDVDLRC